MTDEVLARIASLADEYHQQLETASKTRAKLNALIQWAKNQDYSYPELSKASGLAQGTVQNIVAGRYLNERHRRADSSPPD